MTYECSGFHLNQQAFECRYCKKIVAPGEPCYVHYPVPGPYICVVCIVSCLPTEWCAAYAAEFKRLAAQCDTVFPVDHG